MVKGDKYYLELFKRNIDPKYEKNTPGFIIYDLGVAISQMAVDIKGDINEARSKVDINNLIGDELERFVTQRRGIVRKQATKAQVLLKVTGNGTITKGEFFSTSNDILFESLENKTIVTEGTINAQAKDSGTIGLVGVGTIKEIPVTIQGINKVINLQESYDGFPAETDSELRKRYLDDLKFPITSNNINHFKKWALEVPGVGGVKVIPTWNGNNSVKVLILDSTGATASQSLVDKVQEYIDPIDQSRWGKGYGVASLGAFCIVESPQVFDINVSMKIKIEANLQLDDTKQRIEAKITKYLNSISFIETEVSFARIIKNIMLVEGIIDSKDVTLNTGTQSISIPINKIPKLIQLDVTAYA